MTLADELTAAGGDGAPSVSNLDDARVEQLGRVRVTPFGPKVAMEFVSGVIVLRDVYVDTDTQAVFAGPGSLSVDLGWLYPRGATWPGDSAPVDYARRAVLAPVGRAGDSLGLLLELCASLYVLDRAGRLDGRVVVGRAPGNSQSLVAEACESYDTDLFGSGVDGGLVYVDELVIPQFWVQAVGEGHTFVDAARWAVGGFSREFLYDLRDRLGVDEEVERPVAAGSVGYQARYGQPHRLDRDLNQAVEDCAWANAVVVPPSDRLGIHARAALYSGLAHLVAVYGEDDANVAFMARGSRLDEIFASGYVVGPYCLVADLVGVTYSATILPVDAATAGPPPFTRSPFVDGDSRRRLLTSRFVDGAIRPIDKDPIWIVAALGDDESLLSDWLDYHRAIGIAKVVAVASDVPDAVRAMLASDRFAGFIDWRDEGADSREERLAVAARLAGEDRVFLLPLEKGDFLWPMSPTLLNWSELTASMAFADEIELPVHRVAGLKSVAEHNDGHERIATSSTYRYVEQAGTMRMTLARVDEPEADTDAHTDSEDESGDEAESREFGPVRVASDGIGILRIEGDGRERLRALIDDSERDAGLSSGSIVYDSSLAHAVLAAVAAEPMMGLAR